MDDKGSIAIVVLFIIIAAVLVGGGLEYLSSKHSNTSSSPAIFVSSTSSNVFSNSLSTSSISSRPTVPTSTPTLKSSTTTTQMNASPKPKTSIPTPKSPAPASFTGPYQIPVLQLSYYPLGSDGIHLDQNETDASSFTLDDVRSRVSQISFDLIDALRKGSTYLHDQSNTPSLQYSVYDSKEFTQPIPKSSAFLPFADHIKILNDINICDYVDKKGAKEVWIWMYHVNNVVAPIESNMSMGSVSKKYWNNSTYGDISNSFRQNDLPSCNHTYTVYDYNYTRGIAEALENHTHHFEALFNSLTENGNLFWTKFVNPYGKTDVVNACGWTHYPPNGAADYDWRNHTVVKSNCTDWHPDGSGSIESVSCSNWTCEDDGGYSFKIWWMQRIPGHGNILTYKNQPLRNWWDFVGDFDKAMSIGNSLVAD